MGCRLSRALRWRFFDIALDCRFGVATMGKVSLEKLGLHEKDRVDYEPSRWSTLGRALRQDEVSESDVFLDLGSGKGRIVIQAAMYRFRRVLGVEISPQLHEIALRNLHRARSRLDCQDIVLVNLPAEEFAIPDDVTVVYFYNPFQGKAFATVVQALLASVDRNPRPLRIIYHNACEEAALLATGRVQMVRTVLGGPGNDPIRIYQVLSAGQQQPTDGSPPTHSSIST